MIIDNVVTYVKALATAAGSRVYPGRLPETVSTWPAWVVSSITTEPEVTQDEASTLLNQSIQVTAWANTFELARAMADSFIQSHTGTRATVGALTNVALFASGGPDLYDPESKLFYVPIDLSVWHN